MAIIFQVIAVAFRQGCRYRWAYGVFLYQGGGELHLCLSRVRR